LLISYSKRFSNTILKFFDISFTRTLPHFIILCCAFYCASRTSNLLLSLICSRLFLPFCQCNQFDSVFTLNVDDIFYCSCVVFCEREVIDTVGLEKWMIFILNYLKFLFLILHCTSQIKWPSDNSYFPLSLTHSFTHISRTITRNKKKILMIDVSFFVRKCLFLLLLTLPLVHSIVTTTFGLASVTTGRIRSHNNQQ
jgi:hypothetical protein